MWKKGFGLLFIIILVCIFIIFNFNSKIRIADMAGENYILNDRTYIPVGGRFIKGKMLARTEEGIYLYGLKGDSQMYYLIDSLSNSLYIDQDVVEPHSVATGVFLDDKYYGDEEIVNIVLLLYLWERDSNTEVVTEEDYYKCTAINTSEFLSVYLCYDNYLASQKFVGCIKEINSGYVFIDAEQISNTPYTGKEKELIGIKIKSNYNEILKRYYLKK